MKIIVCIKQVPERDAQVRISGSGKWIEESDIQFAMNESDAYALEEALQLKEKNGGEVVVLSAGPERAGTTIREALAKGADRAIQVESDSLNQLDALGVAQLLASAARQESPDLVLTGLQSDDLGYGQTGVILAELLGHPHASIVIALETSEDGTTLRTKRELENGWFQWVSMPTPAVATIQSGINKPRYASLKGIMGAKKKPVDQKSAEAVGLAAAQIAPREEILSLYFPVREKQTELLEGDAETVAAALVARLRGNGII